MSQGSHTTQVLTQIITEWAVQGRMFTAYEVALTARGRGVQLRYRDLRDEIHQLVEQVGGPNGYTRTLADVGSTDKAWVYHPLWCDAGQYRSTVSPGLSSPSGTSPTSHASDSSTGTPPPSTASDDYDATFDD